MSFGHFLVSILGSVYIRYYIVWCQWKRCYIYLSVFSSACNFYSKVVCLWFSHVFSSSKLSIGWVNFALVLFLYLKASHIGVSIHKIAQKAPTKKRNSNTMTKGTINLICNNLPVERSNEQECMWRTAIKSIESLKKLANLSATFLPLSTSLPSYFWMLCKVDNHRRFETFNNNCWFELFNASVVWYVANKFTRYKEGEKQFPEHILRIGWLKIFGEKSVPMHIALGEKRTASTSTMTSIVFFIRSIKNAM